MTVLGRCVARDLKHVLEISIGGTLGINNALLFQVGQGSSVAVLL